MYKHLSLSLAVIMLLTSFSSCKNSKGDNAISPEGQIEFTISVPQLKSALVPATDSMGSSGITSIIISITDLKDNEVISSEKIELYNMNGYYISRPISLLTGGYQLSKFLVINGRNQIVYASPMAGSPKAYLVSKPLPLAFTVTKDNISKISPEVISTTESTPEDFGYGTFGFEVAQTFDFLVGVFVYNDLNKNYELTSANLKILNNTSVVYEGALRANQPESVQLSSSYDSLGITNEITLPERFDNYILEITKPGYETYCDTFTKEELRMYYRSEDNGPLVVILEEGISLTDGLVAYYKFNGDVLDYSVFNNHGTLNGRKVYSSGRNDDINGALDLDGSGDYLIVNNAPQTNPKAEITLCAWYYGVPFDGNGANSLITKSIINNSVITYQYMLVLVGSEYPSNTRAIGFGIHTVNGYYILNTTGYGGGFQYSYFLYELYNWYFICGTYNGTEMKLYVNGQLMANRNISGEISDFNTDLIVGRSDLNRPEYDFLKGKIDEIKIYNRALSEEEINELYQQ